MKQKVSPVALIIAVILLLAFLLFMFNRNVVSHAPAYTVSAPENDLDGAAAKRANHAKAMGVSPANGAAPSPDNESNSPCGVAEWFRIQKARSSALRIRTGFLLSAGEPYGRETSIIGQEYLRSNIR